ncbi:MAG: RNA polymerase sigma factor [Bacteroidota bacterium]
MSDQFSQLLLKCKRKEREAQTSLYNKYFEFLAQIAQRYCRDEAEAQDVIHDAFISIFHNIGQFQGQEAQLKAWMHRITVNAALQKIRRQQRWNLIELPQEIGCLDGQTALLDKLSAKEIRDLIDTLPEEHRVIINLYIVDQFSHQEIADLLGITASYSRTRLTRAKQRLRQLFQLRLKVGML